MEKNRGKYASNREVKDSAFTAYFKEPENACQLYAALGEEEVSPEDITYVTLEGVLFIVRKNDMAFTVKNRVLVISEHQSTINENMPLRHLIYLGRTLEKLIDERSMYRQKRIGIPTPEFYVFYNGNDPFPVEKIMHISDAYLERRGHFMLELEVKVININLTSGHKLLEQCRPMYEYSWLIQRIKDYLAQKWDRDSAIIQAVKDCREKGILVDFVQKYGSEAVNMLYTQFNMEDAKEVWQEEAYNEGLEEGKAKGLEEGRAEGELSRSRQNVLDLLADLGEIPEDIQSLVYAEENTEILRNWLKAAAKAKNFEDFQKSIE